jgi:hypothetical protein
MQIRWGRVLLVVVLVVLAAYSRQVAAFVGQLELGALWADFCEQIWRTPPLGRFAIVAMVLGLLYVTAYVLLVNTIWKGGKR